MAWAASPLSQHMFEERGNLGRSALSSHARRGPAAAPALRVWSAHTTGRTGLRVDNRTAWTTIAAGAAFLGGMLVRQGLNRAWQLAMHDDPPLDPSSREVAWRDAILWTVATGVVVGLGRLIARRGAAAGWERLTGGAPPL